ncbi:hypothetical protein TEA_026302 [Camellia sinensis var. sinensis]|uniref:Ribose-phosphate pyrophosphokinase N-terminal domain-containing protein n=1 Tax=Camellia sinensis var. sinensis TaxID=542762 RepID=A0A4S4DEU8_CAMSN|nr:hypothetical protein TEA_026302 [Camellia sinensis var. sinensis]
MSTTLPPLSSPSKNPIKTLKPSSSSSLFPNPQKLRFSVKNRIQCELGSFDNPQNWTIDCVSGSDPIHIILKPLHSSIPMASNAALGSPVTSSKKVCLFYCAEMKGLAERIASESDAIELRSITWRTFDDGFPNLFISNAHGIRGQHVAFLASFSSPGVIFEQLSVIYALPKLFVSSFTLVLPFFPTGTSERMEEEGDVATAFTLATILSNIPISRGGPTSLVIFDIHALQVGAEYTGVTDLTERFYFGDNVLPCFESGIPMLKNRLQGLPDSDNISIAFPDDGAWKRFHKQLQHFPMPLLAPFTHLLLLPSPLLRDPNNTLHCRHLATLTTSSCFTIENHPRPKLLCFASEHRQPLLASLSSSSLTGHKHRPP